MEILNNPLVTVGVLTYNSAPFVIETLDSIYRQTYINIELIISDDASQDDTLIVCNNWLRDHSERFVRSNIISVSKNTGTSGNCNRILRDSQGEWLKIIAGDDILASSAISTYLMHADIEKGKSAIFAERYFFVDKDTEYSFLYRPLALSKTFFSPSIKANKQHKILCKVFVGSGPTFFCNKSILDAVGGFDERFPLQEDYPLYIRLTKAGIKLHLIPDITAFLRIRSTSVSHSIKPSAIFSNLDVLCVKEWRYEYKNENEGTVWRLLLSFSLFLRELIIDSGNSTTIPRCNFYYFFYKILDPYLWYWRYLCLKERLVSAQKRA